MLFSLKCNNAATFTLSQWVFWCVVVLAYQNIMLLHAAKRNKFIHSFDYNNRYWMAGMNAYVMHECACFWFWQQRQSIFLKPIGRIADRQKKPFALQFVLVLVKFCTSRSFESFEQLYICTMIYIIGKILSHMHTPAYTHNFNVNVFFSRS